LKFEFKKIHPFYRAENNALRLGAEPEITSSVEDPSGLIEILVNLCDGTRTIDEIIIEMTRNSPGLTVESIKKAISTLDNAGFIGNAEAKPLILSDNELERYNGNIEYFYFHSRSNDNKYEFQEKLKRAKIVVIGLGGAGTPTVLGLASYGVGHIVGVDYDKVELGNLNRQFLFDTDDIGKLKTEILESKIRSINPEISFETITQKITNSLEIEDIIDGADLVICCADEPQFKIQRWVNTACFKKNVKALFGLSQTLHGRIFYINPQKTGCLDCAILTMSKTIKDYEENFKRLRNSSFEPINTVVAPFAMMLGGMIVDEAIRIITNYLPLRSHNKMFELNYTTLNSDVRLAWQKDDQCPTCGNATESQSIFYEWMA
jgi:molybdopterin-synthase adenylyltransferase